MIEVYNVIVADDLNELHERVNFALKMGWELKGGIAVCNTHEFRHGEPLIYVKFYQSMTIMKEED